MDTLINALSLLGSLGMFLYGMKVMSDGLEKFAGEGLRAVLSAMTKNRVMGVFTGILITALIQSSSATTVMVVSFVNAGLMTLKQSIGVIMGANIGTTVTAWIISAVGFKIDIAAFAIPLLALGLVFVFSKNSKRKSLGEFIFGFSFLFMGLKFLQDAATKLDIGTLVANMLAGIADESYLIILLFVFIGMLVTCLVQASAATMAITLMLFDMHIPGFGFEQAAALAMGQNIGTTVTAYIAAMTANVPARRAALAHMFFNVFGVVLVLIIFYPFCNFITWFTTDVLHAGANDLFRLSMFHTAFNVFNTLLLIGFVDQIEQLVCKLLPNKTEQDEEYRLKYISGGFISTSEIGLLEARKEIENFAERCNKMFSFVKEILETKDPQKFDDLYKRIIKYEGITDNMEIEIGKYLASINGGKLTDESKLRIQKMLKMITELESIGDACFNIGRTIQHKREKVGVDFTPSQNKSIKEMFALVQKALDHMVLQTGRGENEKADIETTMANEKAINEFRSLKRNENTQDLTDGKYGYALGSHYMNVISECEKLGDYIINVVQASE
ncbi:MAG: Na/Pi cotransporter family protein [Bacteroidales bacterium]|nr:Na/Pi cotransporter family protein [Bacteroidales bacterium]